MEDGPLAVPADSAGVGKDERQRMLTSQRELRQFQCLDVGLRALPADDSRRLTWLNLDKLSKVWVASCPSPTELSNAEFEEVTGRYFGLPSPAADRYLGSPSALHVHA